MRELYPRVASGEMSVNFAGTSPSRIFVPNRVGARVRRSYAFSAKFLLLLRPIALSKDERAPQRVLRWRRRSAEVL
ncbi:MAG: hypothetical protein PT977_10955 [Acidobacteriota bacterium]|nr:hypothetical protein [Acidobacteriota bacterium]